MFPVVKKPGTVGEMGVFQAQLCGPSVHPFHKYLFRARQVLRHGHGTVVGGDHGDTFEHVADAHLLSFLQIHAAAAEGGGSGAGGDGVIKTDFSGLQILRDQQHGHHLGDAGGKYLCVGILFIQNFSRAFFHQYG